MFSKKDIKSPLLQEERGLSIVPPPLPPKVQVFDPYETANTNPSFPTPRSNERERIQLSSPSHRYVSSNPPLPLAAKPKLEAGVSVPHVTSPIIPAGYQSSIGFVMNTPVFVPPPNKPLLSKNIMDKRSVTTPISSEEATNAMITFVNSNHCYSKKPLSHMTYVNFTYYKSYTLEWEDFVETRAFQWVEEPYVPKQHIDDTRYGNVPDIWSVVVRNTKPFTPMKSHVQIPHSEFIMKCSHCDSNGKQKCPNCGGVPLRVCTICEGSGTLNMSRCTNCKGAGKTLCTKCSNGYLPCNYCNGQQYLKYHLELICERKVTQNIRVVDNSGLPIEYMQFNKGDLDFIEQDSRLSFNSCFDDKNLNFATSELYNASCLNIRNNNSNLLEQKFSLYSCAITKYQCNYNNSNFDVWVLGNNRIVYVPDYPIQKCGCCDIF